MRHEEWSRSRYWLSHYLANRHERQAVAWDQPVTVSPGLEAALGRALNRAEVHRGDAGPWLVRCFADHFGHDPAFVQSFRLLVREQQYHSELIERLWRRLELKARRRPLAAVFRQRLRRPLGTRFEISVLLLSELVNRALMRVMDQAFSDPAVTGVLRELGRDKQGHLAFFAERLTVQYADFNFLRRNLRRLRLRIMFATMLVGAALSHRKLIHAAGLRLGQFVRMNWPPFARMLEQMVPYRREALLQALLQQRQQPYAQPWRDA